MPKYSFNTIYIYICNICQKTTSTDKVDLIFMDYILGFIWHERFTMSKMWALCHLYTLKHGSGRFSLLLKKKKNGKYIPVSKRYKRMRKCSFLAAIHGHRPPDGKQKLENPQMGKPRRPKDWAKAKKLIARARQRKSQKATPK